jgi:ribonuclease HI
MVNPTTNSITHIDIKSQPERHTINRAELAVIAVALKHENSEDHMSILTDSSFCINTIRNYTIDPAAYKHHLHNDLLQLTSQLLRDRDSKHLKTHIGKVKPHTDVEYNETADKTARAVEDVETASDTIFEKADPLIGGLRAWPQIRHTPPNKPENIQKIANLKAGIRKELKYTNKTVPAKGVFGRLLKKARDTRIYFSIQAFSQSSYRSRCDAYEVVWGSHVYRCKKRHNSQGPMLCTKCNQPLTNTHILGGCNYNDKLRTFKLLQDQLEKHNRGRLPIVSMDLGNKTIKEIKTPTQIEMIAPQADPTL